MAKILLVEDDKSLREIYGVRLLAEGYDIVSAGDGEEALAAAIKERPDLILSDVMMPKISGFDMLDILRSTPETKDIKVIIMTALSSEDQRIRGESLGADVYLVKSQVGIEDVVKSIKDTLTKENDSQSQSTTSPVASTTAPIATAAPEAAVIAAESTRYVKENQAPVQEQKPGQNDNILTQTETQKSATRDFGSNGSNQITPDFNRFPDFNDRAVRSSDNLIPPERANFTQPERVDQSSTPNPAPDQWPNQNV